ncbi:Uncharacterized protein HZ326_26578 [Fusarium oxysporum f. sp. albedinis]|nr:Uncharacterized protein HZ326_26578 [Fusarium oxysporum f. sp. albedinis]
MPQFLSYLTVSNYQEANYKSHSYLVKLLTRAARATYTPAIEAWDNLEDRILKNLCERMPNRVNAVITAEDWHIRY